MKKKLFLLLLLTLAACSPGISSLEDTILGTWENPDGFQIQFSPEGTGFIQGVPGQIPDSSFTYSVVDQNHISIDFEGEKFTIEIKMNSDAFTWIDPLGEVIYLRVE